MGYAHVPSDAKGFAPRFQPGALVKFRLARRFVRGRVTEYRGPLAVDGQHLYRVEVPLSEKYVQAYEIPEEELKLA